MLQFAGFSAESLCERIMDSQCCLLITSGKNYVMLNFISVNINKLNLPTQLQQGPLTSDGQCKSYVLKMKWN